MDLQSDYTERLLRWKAHHIREIGIQRHQDAAILNSEAQDLVVSRSGKANLQDGNSVVPRCSQLRGVMGREVFVQKKASLVCEYDLVRCEPCCIFQTSLRPPEVEEFG